MLILNSNFKISNIILNINYFKLQIITIITIIFYLYIMPSYSMLYDHEIQIEIIAMHLFVHEIHLICLLFI